MAKRPPAKAATGDGNPGAYGEEDVFALSADKAISEMDRDDKKNLLCPWCSYKAPYEAGEAQDEAVKAHLKDKHQQAMFAYHLRPELGFDAYHLLLREAADADAELTAGFDGSLDDVDITDELDEFNMLSVPAAFRKKEEAKGNGLYFGAPRNMEKYLQLGFEVVSRTEADLKFNNGHETTEAKSNELILLRVPRKIKARRDALKKKRVRDQSEGIFDMPEENKLDDIGRRKYEQLTRAGMPSQNAMRVAKKVMQKYERGSSLSVRDDWEEGTHTTVTRETGPLPATGRPVQVIVS